MDSDKVWPRLRSAGQWRPLLARVQEAQRERRRSDREPGGETEPQSARAERSVKRQQVPEWQRQHPIGSEGQQRWHAHIQQPAERALANHLAAVEDLKNRGDSAHSLAPSRALLRRAPD